MKKNIFFIFLGITFLLISGLISAANTDAKDAARQTLATPEPSKSPAAEGSPFQKDPFFVEEANPAPPAASVSAIAKKKNAASTVKEKTVQVKALSPEPASKSLVGKKDAEAKEKTAASSAFNTSAMQKRWKALFSREIAPDSIVYTVKPGDSLYVLARKHHTTVEFIKKINGLTSDSLYPGMKLKIHTAPFSMLVDKSKNTLVLYSKDEPVKKYSVATGKKNCTPAGKFKITDKLVHPTWFKTGAIFSPGSPENALGTRWMGFDKPSYGIHGTIEPKSIGTQVSEGCIRMFNEDVEELYGIVPVGTVVAVQD